MAALPRPLLVLTEAAVMAAVVAAVVVAAAPLGSAEPHVYLSSWAVRVAVGPREAQGLARRHGLLCLGQPYYHFKHRGTRQKALSRHWGWNMRLTKEPKVLWFEQQTVKRCAKRSISVVPTDPWFHKQWYMNNDVNPDLNILTAWSKGYTGLGVVLTILDDGIEKDHPDLSANYDPLASYDFNSNDPDPQPRYTTGEENWHGTRCAGQVAAAANNRICGAGVAYSASVGGVRMLDGPITDMVEAQSLSLHPQHIHIYSASWGPTDDGKTVDGPGLLAAAAFHRGVNKGRGGLGSIFIWASGNGGINYDNCNCDGYTNSIYTLSVGSVLAGGRRPWYSEGCSAILTTAYSSRTTSKVQIVTTDLHHRCTDKHTGTSASAPLAVRSWQWDKGLVHPLLGGICSSVSHYYGYGLLDAGLLVEMAKAWTGTQPQRKCSVKAPHAPWNIGSKLTVSTDVVCSGRAKRIRSLEHVQVQLSLSYSRRGDLVITLTSPLGTKSTLVTVRPYDTSQQGYKDWTFMSTHFWDENPNGTWTLELENKGDAYNTGLLTSFILHLYGTDEDIMEGMGLLPRGPTAPFTHLPSTECGSSLFAHQRSCLSYCPPRYYSRSAGAARTARVCASCHPSCYTCQGAAANNCTACPSAGTFDEFAHSCSSPPGLPSKEGLQGDLLPVLIAMSSCSFCQSGGNEPKPLLGEDSLDLQCRARGTLVLGYQQSLVLKQGTLIAGLQEGACRLCGMQGLRQHNPGQPPLP
uniref:Proprotein convertase subtilisin/kexin type 4 n=1 Tax=Amazona collaria TaxID=241587 RepID=A0A8B9ITL9_9PSIT